MAMKTYIVCTGTNGRCVLVGKSETEPVAGEGIVLHNARMILEWDCECGGLLGLASGKIGGDTRITAPVQKTGMRNVTEWIEVEDCCHIDSWENCNG